MAGESGGLDALLQNKLFLQYLSGIGADISAGGTGIAGANAITQQNIQAQNYMKLLKEILAGGGKLNVGEKKASLLIPKGSLAEWLNKRSELGSTKNPLFGNLQHQVNTSLDPMLGSSNKLSFLAGLGG